MRAESSAQSEIPRATRQVPCSREAQRPDAVATKALAVTPPAGAKTDTAVGYAESSIGTANEDSDSDSFWFEEIDFDGDGNSESAEMLWDDEDKVGQRVRRDHR